MVWNTLFIAWLVSSVSTAGSLFFSEVMQFPPCVLCWYQRICMYPLVLILLTALFPLDKKVIRFSLPLAIAGFVIAVYHNLLYYQILPESAAPCREGISCTTIHIEWLGFITIPLLSLLGFSIIITLLLIVWRKSSHEK